jgi:hypothetical protein
MSKDSGLDGIPIPADAVPAKESLPSVPLWNTNVGTISDLVAFYKDYMSGRGWSYDTQYSAIDPDINKAKGLGYVALQNWCSPKTNPPTGQRHRRSSEPSGSRPSDDARDAGLARAVA